MPEKRITPRTALSGESPVVLTATLVPVANLDRFQPAGFPEVGHVIYKAPRADGSLDHVCIVDSVASMANHLESVCMRGPHDPDLVEDLSGMPYMRCVTGPVASDGKLGEMEVVVTSLTEGHRIASSYFLLGEHLVTDALKRPEAKRLRDEAKKLKDQAKRENDATKKKELEKKANEKTQTAKKTEEEVTFQDKLAREFGLVLADSKKAHPPPAKWWDVFETLFKYDPNALVHGVMFPQWQIKISRTVTAHLEAFGAGRVDRSGVKFDRLGKTTSGQPIFAVDDATAREIRATFVLDVALIRSFGRRDGEKQLGLNENQKEFLVALCLWKIQRLLAVPFRFRSGCHLQLVSLKNADNADVAIDVDIKTAIDRSGFGERRVTDIYWPTEELYRDAEEAPETDESPDEVEGGSEEQEDDEGE